MHITFNYYVINYLQQPESQSAYSSPVVDEAVSDFSLVIKSVPKYASVLTMTKF